MERPISLARWLQETRRDQMQNDLPAPVRQRLLNLADKRREPFQYMLVQYGLERLPYRLSRFAYRDRFVRKGAPLFSIWSDTPHRPAIGIDLMSVASAETAELVRDISLKRR